MCTLDFSGLVSWWTSALCPPLLYNASIIGKLICASVMYQDTFNTIIISFSFIFVMIQWMFALSKTDTFGAHLLLSHVSKALPSEHKTQSSREEEVKTFKCYVRLSLLYNACKINMELGRGALRSGLNECPNKRLFKVIG